MSRPGRLFVLVLGLAALLGCAKYPANGECDSDQQCVSCLPCGCFTAYSTQDVDTATCADIEKEVSCDTKPEECRTGGALIARCVSNHCRVTNR